MELYAATLWNWVRVFVYYRTVPGYVQQEGPVRRPRRGACKMHHARVRYALRTLASGIAKGQPRKLHITGIRVYHPSSM